MKVYHDMSYILGYFVTSSLILWRHQRQKTRFLGVLFVGYNFCSNIARNVLKTVLESLDYALSNQIKIMGIQGNFIFSAENCPK